MCCSFLDWRIDGKMDKIEKFWQAFCEATNLQNRQYHEAFQFGESADWLADLVVEGKKTATTSGYVFYEIEKEELPKVGQYDIVLNGQNEPVAIVQNEAVEVLPMNEVTEEFALSEGEGDFAYWWEAHERFFKKELQVYDLTFSRDMLVVCERFKKVFPQ